jgi:hypothetical protein
MSIGNPKHQEKARQVSIKIFFAHLPLLVLLITSISCQNTPLLRDLQVYPTTISANEGKIADVTFTITQPADILVSLENGSRYYLGAEGVSRKYASGQHTFQFNGVVQGYQYTDENYPFEIVQRLVPDGEYLLTVTAATELLEAKLNQKIKVNNGNVILPAISSLDVDPAVITPNEDGIDDAAMITLELSADVTQLSVYVESESGKAFPVPELPGQTQPNAQGLHKFHFEALAIAGDDLENGLYDVSVNVLDRYGQHIEWVTPLIVSEIGQLFGFIENGAVIYSSDNVEINDDLCFSLRVRNNGNTFMRTIGPWSNTRYQDGENFVSLGFPEDKGAFRIGLDYETRDGQYPLRWALGTPGIDLVEVDGEWYLPPKSIGSVSGCVQFNQIPEINPQYVWMGLIHEQTTLQIVNHRVAPQEFTVYK